MAAMKNPRSDVFVDYKDTEPEVNKRMYRNQFPYLYLVLLKDRVFACKAISRTNAIDIASMSHELGDIMETESLSHGRPLNRYQIPDMEVIRVRPYHRGWWVGTGENDGNGDNGIDNNYIYVSVVNGKPTVYKGGSMILDFASSKGMLHKVRVYDSEGRWDGELVV